MDKYFLLFALALVMGVSGCSKNQQADPPNIILLISDDQSWPHYSFLGHEHIQTPRIDQLAAEGLTITMGIPLHPFAAQHSPPWPPGSIPTSIE